MRKERGRVRERERERRHPEEGNEKQTTEIIIGDDINNDLKRFNTIDGIVDRDKTTERSGEMIESIS